MRTQRWVLTEDQLRDSAPSVYAPRAHSQRSGKYSFIPTPEILDTLRGEGWVPTQAMECRVRSTSGVGLSRNGFQKHMIRLAREADILGQYGKESILELVLRNSSDGTCVLQMDAGFFRMVCANGMVVQSADFGGMKFKHMGLDMNDVIDVTHSIVNEAPALMDTMGRWSGLELTAFQKHDFAKRALTLRYGEEAAPVEPSTILVPKRYEDAKGDLWHTYNTVQEQLLKGGAKGKPAWATGEKRRRSVRAVRAIDGSVELNKALWGLAETVEAELV